MEEESPLDMVIGHGMMVMFRQMKTSSCKSDITTLAGHLPLYATHVDVLFLGMQFYCMALKCSSESDEKCLDHATMLAVPDSISMLPNVLTFSVTPSRSMYQVYAQSSVQVFDEIPCCDVIFIGHDFNSFARTVSAAALISPRSTKAFESWPVPIQFVLQGDCTQAKGKKSLNTKAWVLILLDQERNTSSYRSLLCSLHYRHLNFRMSHTCNGTPVYIWQSLYLSSLVPSGKEQHSVFFCVTHVSVQLSVAKTHFMRTTEWYLCKGSKGLNIRRVESFLEMMPKKMKIKIAQKKHYRD